jgi:hypothetical protein
MRCFLPSHSAPPVFNRRGLFRYHKAAATTAELAAEAPSFTVLILVVSEESINLRRVPR